MEASMLQRIEELRGDRAVGVRRLQELSREYDLTRESVLRIEGAMQVLDELLGTEPAPSDGRVPATVDAGG